jgi:hypothetical protein
MSYLASEYYVNRNNIKVPPTVQLTAHKVVETMFNHSAQAVSVFNQDRVQKRTH